MLNDNYSEEERKTRNISAPLKYISDQKKKIRLKQFIWIYLILLIFEGSLRKWLFPEFSNALLIIRDPIAIWILIDAYRKGILTFNFYTSTIILIVFISIVTAVYFGHGNIFVALFGARIFLIHFPLIFVIGKILDFEDVINIGKGLLLIAIPMTVLMIIQFYSPQSAWVNRGVGGDFDGAGFSGALGYFRPPGFFSFTNGLVLFYGLSVTFIFYFIFFYKKNINKFLVYISAIFIFGAIPFSISRTLLFEVSISFAFVLAATIYKPKYFIQILFGSILIGLGFIFLANLKLVQTGADVFLERFNSANEAEGGIDNILMDRFLGGMYSAITQSEDIPFWGFGIGLGTNVGARLTTGSTTFLVSEGEWGRLIGEVGLIMGSIVILIRFLLSLELLKKSINALQKKNFLPWMIISFAFLNILQGQWAQPTSLGFTVFSGGLVLAALKTNSSGQHSQ